MTDLQKYGAYADQFEAAYVQFRRTYELQFPPPVRPTLTADNRLVTVALTVIIVATVVVSASRTVVEFGGGLVGAAAFVMIEGAIVAYAFFNVRRSFDASQLDKSRKLAKRGLWVAFAVGLSANVHAVLKAQGINIGEAVNTAINVMVAISAPILAWISGDVLALEMMANTSRQRKADEQYAAEMETWGQGLNAAWAAQMRKWGIKLDADGRSDATVSAQLSAPDTDGRTADADSGHATGQGYSKRTDARTLVWAYLDAHPDAVELPVRELAELIGAGKSTVSEVKREWKEQHGN